MGDLKEHVLQSRGFGMSIVEQRMPMLTSRGCSNLVCDGAKFRKCITSGKPDETKSIDCGESGLLSVFLCLEMRVPRTVGTR